jgi:hypothetical protein
MAYFYFCNYDLDQCHLKGASNFEVFFIAFIVGGLPICLEGLFVKKKKAMKASRLLQCFVSTGTNVNGNITFVYRWKVKKDPDRHKNGNLSRSTSKVAFLSGSTRELRVGSEFASKCSGSATQVRNNDRNFREPSPFSFYIFSCFNRYIVLLSMFSLQCRCH